MKILAFTIRSQGSTGVNQIGIVLMENSAAEISCRIGFCYYQFPEEQNQIFICERGGKLLKEEAAAFFPQWKTKINSNWKD